MKAWLFKNPAERTHVWLWAGRKQGATPCLAEGLFRVYRFRFAG